MGILLSVRSIYEKNWPEIYAAMTGSVPDFVFQREPEEVRDSVPVFCYHLLDHDTFEGDLGFLAENGYTTLDADAFLDHLLGKRQAPRRSVVLTVDDGMKNLYEVGYPLLRRFESTVVSFVAPRFHEEKFPSSFSERDRPCTWDEIRIMHDSKLVDFQSHSYEHRYIPRWPEPIPLLGFDHDRMLSMLGPDQPIGEDFQAARATLEEKLSKKVRHLAFVKFVGSEEAVEMGRECGYHSFWWGYLPRHCGNCPGQDPNRISRLDGIYLRRLPGRQRKPLAKIVTERFGGRLAQLVTGKSGEEGK